MSVPSGPCWSRQACCLWQVGLVWVASELLVASGLAPRWGAKRPHQATEERQSERIGRFWGGCATQRGASPLTTNGPLPTKGPLTTNSPLPTKNPLPTKGPVTTKKPARHNNWATPSTKKRPLKGRFSCCQVKPQFTERIGLPNFSSNVACALRGFWLPVGVLRT